MDNADVPPITVVISTRNRGDSVVRTIRTILLNGYPRWELRIVDQSEDDLTERALQPFFGDRRVRYIRSGTKGLSTGRNLGISGAQSEFIAITDDDCEVPTNWLRDLVAALAVDSRIGIVYGSVLSGPHDRAVGFVPAYLPTKAYLAHSLGELHLMGGISACMGLRRSLWQALGGFDAMLGAGAPFKAAEEIDLSIRALLAGYVVCETPNVMVIHHGFRTWDQGRTLISGYLYGIGAMLVKHLKCGHWSVIQLLLRLVWRWTFRGPIVDLGHRPPRWLRLAAFVQGFAAGATMPLDGRTGHYVCRR